MSVAHLGPIVRRVREAAGLTRRAFGELVNLSEIEIKNFETGRRFLTTEQLQRILRHPTMREVPALAAAVGIPSVYDPSKK